MHYNHSLEETAEYFRMTLKILGKYGLPLNPVNYTVCYEYATKQNPQLLNAVDAKIDSSQAITAELTNYWFQEYVVNKGKAILNSVKKDLLKILENVFGNLSTAGDELSLFRKSLVRFSDHIEQAEDNETLEKSLKGLLLDVENIEKSRSTLELRLNRANEEVKSLRLKLKQTEQQATTDPLTALLNRRSFETKLSRHMTTCQENKGALSLIMIDIDHFKRINDTYGHLTGDDLLRIIAKTLKDYVKGKDVVCRYGGEEFVLLLPDTPLQGARTVAEKIRKHFSQMLWKQKSSNVSIGKVTLSAGISAFRYGETTKAFIQRADLALYQSKKLGRNRVTVE